MEAKATADRVLLKNSLQSFTQSFPYCTVAHHIHKICLLSSIWSPILSLPCHAYWCLQKISAS
ncbi:MAG: hypothetical protein GFH27_549287n102 [Chloroflexi bacterium AL-W]|nr:hypothetical protein [Chloroflexi bacterium AL-N1]NOK66376.1 hypothetical protein [Chloroflexi bacterium AL-N10]NOK71764.1 hypothetical protein [Chloroflexi bacterium AL-N5]NOK81021.1 hypothetical protein [Chloroflexi bacterium AL-W]NOK89294.1 hypothetical protein [Chloroflexi bacterium AL-N15]